MTNKHLLNTGKYKQTTNGEVYPRQNYDDVSFLFLDESCQARYVIKHLGPYQRNPTNQISSTLTTSFALYSLRNFLLRIFLSGTTLFFRTKQSQSVSESEQSGFLKA